MEKFAEIMTLQLFLTRLSNNGKIQIAYFIFFQLWRPVTGQPSVSIKPDAMQCHREDVIFKVTCVFFKINDDVTVATIVYLVSFYFILKSN